MQFETFAIIEELDRCILFCCCSDLDFNSLFIDSESKEPHVRHSSAGLANNNNLLSADSYVSFRSVLHLELKYCNGALLRWHIKTTTTKPYGEKIRYGIVPNKVPNFRKKVYI